MEKKLNVDDLLRDYTKLSYMTIPDRKFYFVENNENNLIINLVYRNNEGDRITKKYRKDYINSLTCSQFQKDALDLLRSNINILCDNWVSVFKNKKNIKNKKITKKSAKKSAKRSAKKNMKRKQ